jgi:hypothetical protein
MSLNLIYWRITMTLPNDDRPIHAPTADSPDAHIIPAETAARKDREGDHYKQPPADTEGDDSIDIAGGFTVDQEGLVNNYAAEPEMYFETPGDAELIEETAALGDIYTLVDIFSSIPQAEGAVDEIRKAGLAPDKISIIGKEYPNSEYVHGALNWQDVANNGGLAVVLNELGIDRGEAVKYEDEVAAGKLVLLVSGGNEDIERANQILHQMGHRTQAEMAT